MTTQKKMDVLTIALLTSIGFTLFFTSCEENKEEQGITNEKLTTTGNCTDCPELKGVDYPLIFSGNFEYEISKDNGLFIGFQNANDSIYDFFVLQKEENKYPEIGKITDLYLYKDAFYIKSDGEWLMFALDGVEVEKSYLDIVRPENITYGYGVAHATESVSKDKSISGLGGYIERFTSATPECDTGGEGASSCSVSVQNQSCSVECSYGYFACCKARVLSGLSCKCYKKIK